MSRSDPLVPSPPGRWILAGGDVLIDGTVAPADIVVDGEKIEAVVPSGSADQPGRPVDLSGCLVVPGFIDLQVNGAVGVDLLASPGRVDEVSAALAGFGVTAYLPTIISATESSRMRALDALRFASADRGAIPVGVHVEGPVLAPARRGAHPRERLATATEIVAELDRWPDGVLMVTVAPELAGSRKLIDELARRGIVVAVGHTDASAEDLHAAAEAGCGYVTHAFNAMTGMHHRVPGAAIAALVDDRLTVGLIVDGIHLHPDVVRLAWAALGPDRTSLVSDATAALGAPDVEARLGDHSVVGDAGAVRTEDGVLAGTRCGLDHMVRSLRSMTGCSVAEAVTTVTETPARLLGDRRRGRLEAGRRSDLLVCDPDLRVEATMVGGRILWADDRARWDS